MTTFSATRSFAEALFDGMQRHGSVVAGGRHGQYGFAAGLAGEGCRLRSAQSIHRFRDAERGKFAYPSINVRTSSRITSTAIRRLHDLGVMVNASFVFGMDDDDETVFERTVEWAIRQGIETATFHILTPYPGTALHQRLNAAGRITSENWDLYDTRHVVFQPARLSPEKLGAGYWQAYQDFYRWGSIFKSAAAHARPIDQLRHVAYAGGWKKFEPLWDAVIRARRVSRTLPLLESILAGFGTHDTPPQPHVGKPCPKRSESVMQASLRRTRHRSSSTQVQRQRHAKPSFCAAFPLRYGQDFNGGVT